MNIKASDIRRGMVVTMDGNNFVVVDFAHRTPGNLRAFVQAKLKNMTNGSTIEKRLRSDEQLEVPYVERKEYEYLYSSGDEHVFMDTETYDQVHVPAAVVGDQGGYIKDGSTAVIPFHDGRALGVELPAAVVLEVTSTEPGVKGDRVSGATKPATLETGITVAVPLFVETGTRIKVDTREGTYLSRES